MRASSCKESMPVCGIRGSAACSTLIAPQKFVSNDKIICLKSELYVSPANWEPAVKHRQAEHSMQLQWYAKKQMQNVLLRICS